MNSFLKRCVIYFGIKAIDLDSAKPSTTVLADGAVNLVCSFARVPAKASLENSHLTALFPAVC